MSTIDRVKREYFYMLDLKNLQIYQLYQEVRRLRAELRDLKQVGGLVQ